MGNTTTSKHSIINPDSLLSDREIIVELRKEFESIKGQYHSIAQDLQWERVIYQRNLHQKDLTINRLQLLVTESRNLNIVLSKSTNPC